MAIDYYGVFSINRVHGPLKYRFLFADMGREDLYYMLSKVKVDELQEYYGEAKFASFMPFQSDMYYYMEKAITDHWEKYTIVRGSFIEKYVLR